jgi:hypothetical protein
MNTKTFTFLLSFPLLCSTTIVKAADELSVPQLLLSVGGVYASALTVCAFMQEGLLENVVTGAIQHRLFFNNINLVHRYILTIPTRRAVSWSQEMGYEIPDVAVNIANTSLLAAVSLTTGSLSGFGAVAAGPLLADVISPLFSRPATALYNTAKPWIGKAITPIKPWVISAAAKLYEVAMYADPISDPVSNVARDEKDRKLALNRLDSIGIAAIQAVMAGFTARYIVKKAAKGLPAVVKFFPKK